MKDSWNKFLPFDEMLVELFFERLLLDCPELLEQLGPAVDQAPREFLKLIDLAVRGLDPRTESMLREGYRAAPGARNARSRTLEDCGGFFAAYGVSARHWEKARATFVWAFAKAPYLEELERAELQQPGGGVFGRFFDLHVAAPMIAFAEAEDLALSEGVIAEMRSGAEKMLARPQEAGIFFYQTLFRAFPEVLRHFRTADMDQLARHLIETVVFLSRAADQPRSLRSELRNLASVHQVNQIPAGDYDRLAGPLLETIGRFGEPLTERTRRGWVVLFGRVVRIVAEPMAQQEALTTAARSFLEQVAAELEWSEAKLEKRWSEITHEVRATGTYTQTFEELEHGARMAWRHAPKCIGRISWRNLIVRDRRHVTDPDEIFAECRQHLVDATNGGNIEIVMTVFRQTKPQERWGPRIWNSQLIRYAGYGMPEGAVLGDKANLDLTSAIMRLGWTPPRSRSAFDILPVVVDVPGQEPRIYEWDAGEIVEVPIEHPSEPGLTKLGMKWCAVPAIANFRLEIGGLDYGCVPFNGWFMGTEIARNLFEEKRYDRAADIAATLGLDMSRESTLWRDRAFLELNTAIIHSFAKARVTLVDHQTASRQFMIHDLREKRAGRECPAQWSWIAPAAGGSTTPVWHHEMRDFHLSPSYGYAADRWMVLEREIAPVRAGAEAEARGPRRPLVLFASETGTAEAYARQASRRLASLAPRVMAAGELELSALAQERQVLVIAATCRAGDVPSNGQALVEALQSCPAGTLDGVSFAVLGIGNRIYPHFCAAAVTFDTALEAAGAQRLSALQLADEIAGQAETVKQWLEMFAKLWSADAQATRARRAIIELLPAQQAPAHLPGMTAVVAFNREMLGADAGPDRSTRHIGFDLDRDAPPYQVGDHLAIQPINPPHLVAGMARHLGLPANAWFKVLGTASSVLEPYRQGFSLETLLAEVLDCGLPDAPEELFNAMQAVTRDDDDRVQLGRWIETLDLGANNPVRRQLLQWLRRTYLTLVELFDAFPRSIPDLETLIEILPRLRPRLYSIGSSPLVHPRQVRIMAGVLSLPQMDGRVRQGRCSHYLRSLDAGARVRLSIKAAPHEFFAELPGPLLLIGAGTGLSPLHGLLEDRIARGIAGSDAAPAALYFGCRNEAEFLERPRLTAWRQAGHIQRLSVALSRQGAVKAYVQDALDADAAFVTRLLEMPDVRVVVCGDAKMAQDVGETLLRVIQREAGLGYAGAQSLLESMRQEGRYIEDVWGLQLNHDLALSEMVRTKYDSGTTWLARLQRALVGRAPAAGAILQI